MLRELTSPRNIIASLILLVACCVFALAASAVGISDNQLGIVLAFLSSIAVVLAFVHQWRTSKQFRYLIYASGIGVIFFAVLHNVFEGIASKVAETSMAYDLLNGASVAFFMIAILVCPSGMLVGIVGVIVMSNRERHL